MPYKSIIKRRRWSRLAARKRRSNPAYRKAENERSNRRIKEKYKTDAVFREKVKKFRREYYKTHGEEERRRMRAYYRRKRHRDF
jgi:hypothetical protein